MSLATAPVHQTTATQLNSRCPVPCRMLPCGKGRNNVHLFW